MASTIDVIIPDLFLVTITPQEEFLEWKLYSNYSKNPFTSYCVISPTTSVHSYDVDYVHTQFFEATKDYNIVEKWDNVLITLIRKCEELWIIKILEHLSKSTNEIVVESVILNPLLPTKILTEIESNYPVKRIRTLATKIISQRLLRLDGSNYKKISSIRKEFNPSHLNSFEFLEWAEKASIDELDNYSFVKPKLSLLQQFYRFFK